MITIDLEKLATVITYTLGADKFAVYSNGMVAPQYDGRIPGVLQATRIPFALENAPAETLDIKLVFDMPSSPQTLKEEMLKVLTEKLLGWVTFEVDGYRCDAFLSHQLPNDPRADTGTILQQFIITGTMLVVKQDSGVLTSNRIKTYIDDIELQVISYAPSLQKGAENVLNLSEDKTTPNTTAISNSNTYALTILFTGTTKEMEFVGACEGEGETDGINGIYTLKRIYPNGYSYINVVKLMEATLAHNAGAFITLTLRFQKVG